MLTPQVPATCDSCDGAVSPPGGQARGPAVRLRAGLGLGVHGQCPARPGVATAPVAEPSSAGGGAESRAGPVPSPAARSLMFN